MMQWLRSWIRRIRLRLPDWAERHASVRAVVLLKELLLVDRPGRFYGQYAEDVLIDRLFVGQASGVFVDVGCFHPFRYNNTYLLYRRGWRGVNIDLDAVKVAGFRLLRRKDTNVCCAITRTPGAVEYYTPEAYSIVASLHREHVAGFSRYAARSVRGRTLDSVLDESPYRDRPIDLLNVDAEGHDLDVLQSLDFARYRPRIIVVESFAGDLDALVASELYRFVVQRGYDMIQWAGLSVIFRMKAAAGS